MNRTYIIKLAGLVVSICILNCSIVYCDYKSGWIGNKTEGWSYLENNNYRTGWINENNKWYFIDSITKKTVVGGDCIDGIEYMFNTNGEMVAGIENPLYNDRFEKICDEIVQIWLNNEPGNYYYKSNIEVSGIEEAKQLAEYGQCNYLLYGTLNLQVITSSNKYRLGINMSDCRNKANKHIEADKKLREYVVGILDKNMSKDGCLKEFCSLIKSNIKYSGEQSKNSGYSGLILGETACHGFAVINVKACRMMGIPCEYILGVAANNKHGWNRITIDNSSVYLDCSTDSIKMGEELFPEYSIERKVGW